MQASHVPLSERPHGLYEALITEPIAEALGELNGLAAMPRPVDRADLPHVLARHVYAATLQALQNVRDPEQQLLLANRLIDEMSAGNERVVPPARQLLRLTPPPAPGVITYPDVRPSTPLADAALLTNAKSEPNLGPELKKEIDTSDNVDLLCAFVRWAGLRLLEPELRRLKERGGRLRVITTTYLGSTERRALDRLAREYGAEVRIQYDAQRTRLHAKAWMFHRNTGFDTAYVGSSNLTVTALLEGVEWNVRLSRVATPDLLDKFNATFDTYWNDSAFEAYNPETDVERLDAALAEAGGRSQGDRVTISLSGLEVTPFPYQQEMLDEIDAERVVHDRHRNLVVAATGTGKTVVAALDYRRLAQQAGEQPSLLFVAHRKEILHQSLRTYREVLADPNFGELYVDGQSPAKWKHVFASVQSLTAYGVGNVPPDAFEIVVIDEFHHAAAKTYRKLIDRLEPRELLGLTATPERADGINVRDEFFDGRIATELRLWDALGADLLCPFHYFAVSDNTDLRDISWARGQYDASELSNVYTGNDARTRIILKEVRDKILDPGSMRALGFCVSVAHAEYMTRSFNEAGIPARIVTGTTTSQDRAEAIGQLRAGDINVLFTVDVFNEGLDIPSVDTILFLRPTESATIFLQQLGRGLRRTGNKAVLTVLDFVGFQSKHFRWDQKLGALTGLSRGRLQRQIEDEFPFLPSGCQIVMDEQAQAAILDNIKAQVGSRWADLIKDLRATGDVELGEYLKESGVSLADILKPGKSWTRLRRDAGFATLDGSEYEEGLLKRGRAFAHVDDRYRAQAYETLLRDETVDLASLSSMERRLTEMLFFSLWPNGGGFESVEEGVAALRKERAARSELTSVIDLAFDQARHRTLELAGPLANIPLQVHARYQREEILSAVGYASLERKPTSVMQGVVYSPATNTDVFFVTLKKSEAAFSPTTMYRDYPISPTLFHWESQSTTSVASPTGQRYLNGTSNVLLFVREQEKDELGTSPYLFLGPARYVSHEGERPIAITWQLDHPMPTDFFHAATVAAG